MAERLLEPMTLIFNQCRLIDGISPDPRESCDVVVKDDRLVAIENSKNRSTGDSTVIAASGYTMLPGLIDCHTHYVVDPWEQDPFGLVELESDAAVILRAARSARIALEAGVTTTRDAGAPRQLNFTLRDAVEGGLIPGPRILAPGMAITITGGHGYRFGIEADGITELKKAARAQMRDGADVIKIIASEAAMLTTAEAGVEELTREEIEMLVCEARRRGLRIFSHAQNSTSVVRSAQSGVDSVEHGFLASSEAIGVLKECGTTLVPTLTVTAATLEQSNSNEIFRRRILEIRDMHWASCEEAIRQGVNLAAGTDCGMPGVYPNMLWREICLLHERGLTKMKAIKAATFRAAELLGVGAAVGSIEPGKQADLILVRGNPMDDLSILRDVDFVMKKGEIVHCKKNIVAL